MAKRVGVDKWLYFAAIVLVVIGLAMVFSASAVMSGERFGSPYYFVIRQSVWAVFGLVAMTFLMRVPYSKYNRPTVVFPVVAVTIILLLVAFFMHDSHNTHRWIRFGILSFQPSEIAKPALVLFLAWFLQNRMHLMEDWRTTLIPAALPSLIFIALILKEPDLGTALVCAGVTALMLWLAGMHPKYLGYAAGAAAPVLYLMLFAVKWRRDRMLAFVNPESDPLGKGFHIIQSLIAVGSGGFRGVGYMDGRQKLFYLPEPHTDYIFANVCRGTGTDRRADRRRAVRFHRMARHACGDPFQRSLRAVHRLRHHRNDSDPGLLQHQRCPRTGADQGHHAAVCLLRWNLAVHHAGARRSAAERYP